MGGFRKEDKTLFLILIMYRDYGMQHQRDFSNNINDVYKLDE